MEKKSSGTQITKRINADGVVTFTEEKEIGGFDRFPEGKGYILIASNRKLMNLVRPGFPKGIKAKDLGILIELCGKHLSSRGLIMDERFPIQKQELPEVMQMHRNSVHTFILRLEALAVIRLVNDFIYVNPLYLTTSTYLPAELYAVFKPELDPHLPDWVIHKYRQLQKGTVQ